MPTRHGNAGWGRGRGPIATVTVARLRLLKNGDEHRRNILQTVLRFRPIKKCGVLPQFVCHLINNESTAPAQRVIGVLQECTLLLDFENAERNAREDVVALSDAASAQLFVEVAASRLIT
jgi:hypothetical protein